jgi:hypothetical protein
MKKAALLQPIDFLEPVIGFEPTTRTLRMGGFGIFRTFTKFNEPLQISIIGLAFA